MHPSAFGAQLTAGDRLDRALGALRSVARAELDCYGVEDERARDLSNGIALIDEMRSADGISDRVIEVAALERILSTDRATDSLNTMALAERMYVRGVRVKEKR